MWRLAVHGREHLPQGPCVLVANHASYLDGLVLLAALPMPFAFVAKRAFLDHPITRIYLQKLGTQFVERFDSRHSVEDAARMAGIAAAGTSMAFFPEGTFRRVSGLAPFRLGAFVAAVKAGTAVLPVAIRGTREALREGQWLARRRSHCATRRVRTFFRIVANRMPAWSKRKIPTPGPQTASLPWPRSAKGQFVHPDWKPV